MKVSIVIPAYNEEAYIADTLCAVLTQSCRDIEIIVVNNNSTDKTKEKVSQFPSVRLVDEPKRGVQNARERGRKEALGEIIVNLDADCLPPTDWIENGLKYFGDPRVVAVSGPYDYYDGTKIFRILSSFIQGFCFVYASKVATRLVRRGAFVMGGNVFIRASALEEIGGYNTSIAFYGDDTDTANRLLSVGKVLYLKDIKIRSSARRFKRLGAVIVFWRYMINFLWVVLFKKPYHGGLLE